jgi:predicted metal-dependent hydrolase
MTGETRILKLNTGELPYELRRHGRARRVNIRVVPGPAGGRIVVTVPTRGSIRSGERFLARHADWAMRQSARLVEPESRFGKLGKREYRKRRDEAVAYIRAKVEGWNRFYGFSYGRITVRDQKTRWGSCSETGNLSFSWKLLLLPERLADYIVVHELCHLAELNHSDRFWAHVARAVPEYRTCIRELRDFR